MLKLCAASRCLVTAKLIVVRDGRTHRGETRFPGNRAGLCCTGWWVFPCHTILATRVDGQPRQVCSCSHLDCGSPGKHPFTKNGFLDAARDPEQIERWFARERSYQPNIGIDCARSGLIVVDI